MNEELLREARARSLENAQFRRSDLSKLPEFGVAFDGLWCSFTAAYFLDLPAALASWARDLRPGGWVAMTEIDDLFGHEPLGTKTKALFEAYARDAFVARRYDFRMGRKLENYLKRSGFMISKLMTVEDQELSFAGPARPEVVEAWRNRLDRMKLLRDFCGADFDHLREEFLSCLTRTDHHSLAKVHCCIATKSNGQ
jgi:ubiquinone/menaquinone biosynthesis C-methylase UbiE